MAQQPFFFGAGPTTSLTSEKRWKLCAAACPVVAPGGIICGERCGDSSGWCCVVAGCGGRECCCCGGGGIGARPRPREDNGDASSRLSENI